MFKLVAWSIIVWPLYILIRIPLIILGLIITPINIYYFQKNNKWLFWLWGNDENGLSDTFYTDKYGIFTNDANDKFYTMKSDGIFCHLKDEVLNAKKTDSYGVIPYFRFSVAKAKDFLNKHKGCVIVVKFHITDDFEAFLHKDFREIADDLYNHGITEMRIETSPHFFYLKTNHFL